MAALWFSNYHFTPVSISPKKKIGKYGVVCGLRDKGLSKKPLWRKAQDMSPEAIHASRALRLACSDPENTEKKIAAVFESKISRLLKSDLLALLYHLQRLDSCDIAIQVFEYARRESWYKPEIMLYYDMLYMLGRNKLVEKAKHYFQQLQEEGLQPDTRVFTEIIGAYMEVGQIDKAMEMYGRMKEGGCQPNELTLTILIKNLIRFRENELVGLVKRDVEENVEEWEVFMRNVEGKSNKKGVGL